MEQQPVIKVIIIGPSVTRTKGGMATVINDMLENKNPAIQFRHIVSHIEGSAMEKIRCNLKAIIQFLKTKEIDVVHIHVASGASFYRKSLFVLLSRFRGIPTVMHVHGADFDSFYQQSSGIAKRYIQKIFSLCSKTLVLSNYWKAFFVQHIINKNVEVLHNGVYVSVFANCYTMPLHLKRFLFLGRLGQRKGVYDLIEAADRLINDQQQKDLPFYLAGDGEVEEVKRIVKERRLDQHIKVLGWIGEKEKKEWLLQADTMVLPSYNEGLPMSILESMAAGKVIISGRVGGIPDLVKEGENGFLITPGDVNSLADHIQYVSTHPQEMLKIAAKNQQKIDQDYNLEKLNNWVFKMYQEIINRRRRS